MAYRFRKNEALPHAVRRVFMEEIDWAVGQLAGSTKRIEAVHEARKSIKKIRGLLALIAKPLGSFYKAEDRNFRHTAKRLSTLRDSAVMLETLNGLAAKHPDLDSAALAFVRHNLERLQREASPYKQISATVTKALKEARPRCETWPLEELGFATLLPDLTAAYRGGRKALREASKQQSPEALHDFRKRVKQHWYHLRLCDSILTSEMRKRTEDLRELETWLGDEHNINVLCDRISAEVETSRDRHQLQPVLALLEEDAQHLRRRALESGERLYAPKPEEFSAAMAALWPGVPKRPAAAASLRKAAVA